MISCACSLMACHGGAPSADPATALHARCGKRHDVDDARASATISRRHAAGGADAQNHPRRACACWTLVVIHSLPSISCSLQFLPEIIHCVPDHARRCHDFGGVIHDGKRTFLAQLASSRSMRTKLHPMSAIAAFPRRIVRQQQWRSDPSANNHQFVIVNHFWRFDPMLICLAETSALPWTTIAVATLAKLPFASWQWPSRWPHWNLCIAHFLASRFASAVA